MSVTLEIKADAKGALELLGRINALEDTSVRQTERLAAITGTIRGHWSAIGNEVVGVNRQLLGAMNTAQHVAGAAKLTHVNYLATLGVVQNLRVELQAVAGAATNAARVANGIRVPHAAGGFSAAGTTSSGSGSAGFSFSPAGTTPLPPGAGARPAPIAAAPRPGGFNFTQATQRGAGFAASGFNAAGGILDNLGGGVGGILGIGLRGAGHLSGGIVGGVGSGLTTGASLGGLAGPVGSIVGAGVGAALGPLVGGVQAAFKIGVDVLNTGVKMAVSILDTGVKAAMVAGVAVLGNSIRLAVKQEPIEAGFGALVKSKGLGDQKKVIEELRESARGAVSDLDLMQNANAALQLGAARTTADLQLLVEGGRKLGKAMGRDATDGFQDLALGIGRASKPILDNLGIIISVDEVNQRYADSVGATVEALSEQEKKLAFQKEAFVRVKKAMDDLGEEHDTAGEAISRLGTTFDNLSVKIGQAFLPMITEAADNWSKFIGQMTPDKIKSTIGDGLDWIIKKVEGIVGPDLMGNVKNVGTAFYDALVNPSGEAFKVLALHGEHLVDLVSVKFQLMWVDFKAWAIDSFTDILRDVGVKMGKLMSMFPIVGAAGVGMMAAANAFSGYSALDHAIDRSEVVGESSKKNIDWRKSLDSAQEELKRVRNQAPTVEPTVVRRDVGGRSGPSVRNLGFPISDAGTVASASPTDILLAAERRAREEATEATKKQKDAIDEANRVLRMEISEREKLLGRINDEVRDRQNAIDEMGRARLNSMEALAGRAAPTTLIEDLNTAATELRKMPDVFLDLTTKMDEEGKKLAKSLEGYRVSIEDSFSELDKSLHRQAQSFLQEAPQDGETVRVRATKRRAQRDLRRLNTGMVNEAFRSNGLTGFDEPSSMFGDVGNERAGSALQMNFPRLEAALLNRRNNDGTTQIAAFQERIAHLVEQHNAAQAEGNALQQKLLAEQEAAHARQEALEEKNNALLSEALSVMKMHRAELDKLFKDRDSVKRDLERLAALARSRS